MSILREIVEEHCVAQEIDKLNVKHVRLEEVFSALKWRLAKQPQVGYRMFASDGTDKYLIKTDPNPTLNIPGILLLYTYNDIQVNIIDIRVDEP